MEMYKIQEESNYETMLECLELGKLHYQEVTKRQAVMPYRVHTEMLKMILDAGLIHIVTARDESQKLVGYFANLVSQDFMTSEFQAKEIGIYVDKSKRGGVIFKKMVDFMEDLLKYNGVRIQLLGFQNGHNDKLPLKLGYDLVELVYEKDLGE